MGTWSRARHHRQEEEAPLSLAARSGVELDALSARPAEPRHNARENRQSISWAQGWHPRPTWPATRCWWAWPALHAPDDSTATPGAPRRGRPGVAAAG